LQWFSSSSFLGAVLALLLVAVADDATAADPGGITGTQIAASAGLTIDGSVRNPQIMTVEDIRDLPATRVNVTYQTREGEATASFTGVLVWTLLDRAGGINEAESRADIRGTLMITGRDGYAVALSVGEIDPKLAAEPAIIAYLRDDQPLDSGDALQLVMPWDRHATRNVRDVVRIEVKE
jgi:DMSO/TMAO reductase YedYZ molybdopterin-dependent catalytic subunit